MSLSIMVTYDRLFDWRGVDQAVEQAIAETLDFGKTIIARRTPVLTGRLQSEWRTSRSGREGKIYNDVPYGVYVEYGSARRAPRGMMARSVGQIEHRLERAINNKLEALES